MSNVIRLESFKGTPVEFTDEIIASGAMKDVYFSPDKTYVVAFFRKPIDHKGIDRLKHIIGTYKKRVFNNNDSDLEKLFCWPTDLVSWNGKTGVVCPAYEEHFHFTSGQFKGKEKEGKWFASAKLRNRFLEPGEKGNWRSYFHICTQIAHAVQCLHSAALAHSDLSYRNVLVDPQSGTAVMIDMDGLIKPGQYTPDVVGTPDFIAPEVLETRSLKLGDPKKVLPGISTDRHALAVLIYMYLLYRHPLRGGKVHDLDPVKDENLSMGAKAVFIEHPADLSNRPKLDQLTNAELPQGDVTQLPYTICGPYLQKLFNRAFINGLHNPALRPSAAEWEEALIKTTRLLRHCQNPECEAQWFVLTKNEKDPHCPFCGHAYTRVQKKKNNTLKNEIIDVPDGIEYPKPNTSIGYVRGKIRKDGHCGYMVAASRRGPDHLRDGKPRDDHFVLRHCPKSDWYILAVADGAASAEFSRKGSEIACTAAVDFCEEQLRDPDNSFDAFLKDFLSDIDKYKNKLLPKAYEILVRAAYKALIDIQYEAKSKNRSIKLYATTLLLTICKKLPDDSYIILSFTIGNGSIGIIYKDNLGISRFCLSFNGKEKDISDKEFITMPELFKNSNDLVNRICVKKINNFISLIMMTAGVSDEKFKGNNINNEDTWIDLWSEIFILINMYGYRSKSKLLEWLDYFSFCNYDDRTIAIHYQL